MKERKTIPVGTMFMIIVLALATLGVGYGLWSKTLTITGVMRTGDVHAVFEDAFTDDDDVVNDPAKDSQDVDGCVDLGDVDQFTEEGKTDGNTSCDPAASGRDPKPHHDKDVAACVAEILADPQTAKVTKYNVYPSYYCTAWFDFRNDGSIPVKIASVRINGRFVAPSVTTPFDLNEDDKADVEIHVSEIKVCQQVEPNELVQMNIDQHVLQDAPQGGSPLIYEVKIQLNQYNETSCRVLLYYGNGGVDPGTYSGGDSDLHLLKAHYEAMGFGVDYTDVWPSDLSIYRLVVIHGPGDDLDDGTHYFTAAQKGALTSYMQSGGRVVVNGDYGGLWGYMTVNDLLSGLGVGITQNPDTATPDGDACGPLTDITPDQVTAGLTFLDPSAVSSLTLSGSAVALARVDPPTYTCNGGVINGAIWMAVDQVAGTPARPGGDLIMIADFNAMDDKYGFSDLAGDGFSGPALATNLVGY
ncbi:MAG: hypothetical protein GTO14_19520 [Anaerolineales bacterium]|nr:hypothetical protein [Anaerolineales bacterium]